jgi:quercetin dioxygenase-like cupin family protein
MNPQFGRLNMFRNFLSAAFVGLSLVSAAIADPMLSAVNPLNSLRFEADSDVKCLQSATEAGDATAGPSTFMLKAPVGCLVPWHYHTAQEQAVVVRGVVKMEMIGASAKLLGPGGFAVMQGKVPHQFSCSGKLPCLIMASFDRKYDIFWGRAGQ